MQPTAIPEHDVITALVAAITGLEECTSDQSEREACTQWLATLSLPLSERTEQLVRQLRDELEHYKSSFNDSLDRQEKTVACRQQAREVATRAVNFYVLRRRPDLKGVVERTSGKAGPVAKNGG
jgi:hypothetical protein